MRQIITLLIAASALVASPALGREPDRPVTDNVITAEDVAATPLTDLNLRKDEIPPQLLAAQENPYGVAGLSRCARIAAAVGELDAILGDDIDIARDEKRGPSAGRMAQWVVGSFIPFRGALRELSGANETKRQLQVAIQAGVARRAFLKGVGEARGCHYPARSATAAVIAQHAAQQTADARAEPEKENRSSRRERREAGDVTFVSQPVVQKAE